jgi:integrase
MTAAKTAKRRSPGEGGAYRYTTGAGERWFWKASLAMPDGTTRPKVKRGFTTKKAAQADLRKALDASDEGGYSEPSKQPLGAYLSTWADGLRLAPSTMTSYKRNIRVHVLAYPIAATPLASLTPAMPTAHYRMLEASGLRGAKGERTGRPLSARSVRYLHTIVSSALKAAVTAGQLPASPAARASAPTAKQAAAPEMSCWTAAELGRFLGWAREHSGLYPAWHVAAMTGMRRGELLALRWRDADLAAGTVSVRRSAVPVREHGQRQAIKEGPPKSGKPRVVSIDPATVAVLKAHKRERGTLALSLARDDALLFGDLDGRFHSPEHLTKAFGDTVGRCRKETGEDLPVITLHGLRHSHVSILLSNGVPVKTVSSRIGHSSPLVTMTVYAHLLAGDDEAAAGMFAGLVSDAVSGAQVSAEYHGPVSDPVQMTEASR